ncbi:hypothetical protein TNCV_4356851 [Trichonephila clavipes]|nr:hypothetical protein TNCV_4356851 [Trichonephila clavipes]
MRNLESCNRLFKERYEAYEQGFADPCPKGISGRAEENKSAAWSDRREFTAAFTSSLSLKRFPRRLCLRYWKKWKSLGERSGLYGAWSKTLQPKNLMNSRVVRKVLGFALSWRSKTPFEKCQDVCFAMLFGASVELRSRHLS